MLTYVVNFMGYHVGNRLSSLNYGVLVYVLYFNIVPFILFFYVLFCRFYRRKNKMWIKQTYNMHELIGYKSMWYNRAREGGQRRTPVDVGDTRAWSQVFYICVETIEKSIIKYKHRLFIWIVVEQNIYFGRKTFGTNL